MENVRRRNSSGERFLSFLLGKEEYCIEIGRVREIMAMVPVTPLPQTPAFIRGVINLRGAIIPIVDLRLKFGMEERAYNDRTCIIVVDAGSEEEKALMGVVVDTILEVVGIEREKISGIEYVNARVRSEYIRGIAQSEQGVKIVLDIARVLAPEELSAIKEAGDAARRARAGAEG
jgi:purine-binding chemotaxis protein CheW